ncbi:hypothetical protein, partial [Kitasatospora sp. NPDC008115]|uniref:hypothetical protein n=1 Tax=Kitasatospora sp. NPDC008115 TaxID=3364022 RepID=UPI0036E2C96C
MPISVCVFTSSPPRSRAADPGPGGADDRNGAADLGWNAARRLADLAGSTLSEAAQAAIARAAVDGAMRHALGTALR